MGTIPHPVATDRDVLALAQVGPSEAADSGGKAATLAALRGAGFPVPDGFVVSADALERAAEAAGLGPDRTEEQAAALDIDEALAARILAAAERLGAERLAVRSSGVAEDGAHHSFAGQYASILDVAGGAALLRAVRQCWASAFTGHAAAYRVERGLTTGDRLAVLVQPMVPARAAGIAFTANPVTHDRGETVVNAVPGLGDRLADGAAAAEEWVVRDGRAERRSDATVAVTAAEAVAVAELARRVEAHLGHPVDMEWAMAGDELVVLQARAITTPTVVPRPVPAQPPPGHWIREASHAPVPWTPFTRALLLIRDEGLRLMCTELGYLFDGVLTRDIGGWEYYRLVPLGGKDRRPPPDFLVPVLLRAVPVLRKRVAVCRAAQRGDVPSRLVRRWYDEWLPAFSRRLDVLHRVEPSPRSPNDLIRYFDDAVGLFNEAAVVHFRLHGALGLLLAELVFACRELFGWDDARAITLLTGLSDKSVEPSRRLAELATLARSRPAVQERLLAGAPPVEVTAPELDPDFAAAFAAYQREYGERTLRYEVAEPTLAEQPGLTLNLIRDQLSSSSYDPASDAEELAAARATAEATARRLLAGRPAGDRQRFDRALERARLAYPVREDNVFFTISGPLAVVRRAALAAAAFLVARGQLDRDDDVFYLEPDEVRAALRTGAAQHDTVARRRGERAWVLAHPGPPTYGPAPGPPPSTARLPKEVATAAQALLWYVECIAGLVTAPTDRAREDVRGIAASPGRYTGPARIVENEGQLHRVRAGDVLVCPTTSPAWSVVFSTIGALVTDSGGTLSHPAIIAREYRVPAVVATATGTSALRDGQLVTVDGTAGTVEVIP